MNKTYLIIGTSAAGLGTAVKLRNCDTSATIICLTAEDEMPYNRCLLADYLSGSKTADLVATKPELFFTENNIILMRNALVVSIDRTNQTVKLADNRSLSYDELFLGVGRSGWIPSLPGSTLQGVFPFYGLADTNKILSFIKDHNVTHATVVGAGLSGLECADALANKGLQVDIIERASHCLPNQLDAAGGAFLASIMHKDGVNIRTLDSVQEINGSNGLVKEAVLASGKKIATQMVIFAIGGKVNSHFAQTAGIVLSGAGILVNEYMQTSDPHIYAGGDVCLVKDILTGTLVQSCLWPDAVQQGMIAASNMAGGVRPYAGTVIITSSHIYNTTFVSCGPITNPPVEYQQIVKTGPDFYHKFLVQDGVLKGFAMIGKVDNVGMLRKKMVDRTPVEIA